MIQAYSGEFTVSPIPLEMSMNYCSHKCAYCFANLNKPNRTFDAKATINKIKNCEISTSLTSYLIKNKYPVLLSNLVDPFSFTNWRQSLSFIEILSAHGNKISFQTKGGTGIDDAISLIDYKSCWYVSIAFLNDDLRKKIEPGSPSIESRFEMIEMLISKGHSVSVGINPLQEEWLPFEEFKILVDRLYKIGVKNYWIEILHLNHLQVKNLSEKEINAIGEDLIQLSSQRFGNYSYYNHCREYLLSIGANVFSINQSIRSDYFKDYHSTYKTINTNQDFVNYCFEKYPEGGEIKFSEYYDFMKADFYETRFNECDGYVYRTARNVYKRIEGKPFKTIKEVMIAFWENIDIEKSLFMNELFSILSYKENGKSFEYRCKENNMIIYWFNAGKNCYSRHFIY